MSFAVLRISECDAMASFPDATSRSSHAASTFSPRIARVPPGTERTSATQEIDPFWTPCDPAARTAESQDSDMDVSDWLMDGLPKQKINEDTVDISRTEVAHKAPAPPAPVAPPPAPAESDSKAGLDSGSKAGQKTEPGKLPPQPKTTSANSMSAAAEALKKLSQRR